MFEKLNNNLSCLTHTSLYSYWLPLCQKSQICESCSHRRHQRVSCPSVLQQARSHVRAQLRGKHKTFASSAGVAIVVHHYLVLLPYLAVSNWKTGLSVVLTRITNSLKQSCKQKSSKSGSVQTHTVTLQCTSCNCASHKLIIRCFFVPNMRNHEKIIR